MKICTVCREAKSKDQFGVFRLRGRRHRRAKCKLCHAAESRKYYEAHKEERRVYQSEYRAEQVADPERLANRRAYGRAWYRKNKAEVIAYQKEWQKSPIGRAVKSAVKGKRKAAMAGAEISGEEWLNIADGYASPSGVLCVYCFKPIDGTPTMDHVVPLAGGGKHELENVAPACFSCNASKQNTPLLLWMATAQSYQEPPTSLL